MKALAIALSLALLAGCTTLEETLQSEPKLVLTTQRSVDDYMECLSAAWALNTSVHVTRIEAGKRIYNSGGSAGPAYVMDVVDQGGSRKITYWSNTYRTMYQFEDPAKACAT